MAGPGHVADSGTGLASLNIEALLKDVPQDGATIDWLLAHLISRSPEFLLLAFTPIAVVPATSPLAGALLLVTAVPLVFHRHNCLLPRFLTRRRISPRRVDRAFKALSKILNWYEAYARRRPHAPARHHSRLVGIMVAMLSAALLVPLPFSNVLPGVTIGTVAVASLEQDDRLLTFASLLTAASLLLVFWEGTSAYHLTRLLLRG